MLRISVSDGSKAITFKLEGKLSDAWAKELEHCWTSIVKRSDGRSLIVDLTAVSFIDGEGRRVLTEMNAAGAHLVAGVGLMTRQIIRDIERAARRGSSLLSRSGNAAMVLIFALILLSASVPAQGAELGQVVGCSATMCAR